MPRRTVLLSLAAAAVLIVAVAWVLVPHGGAPLQRSGVNGRMPPAPGAAGTAGGASRPAVAPNPGAATSNPGAVATPGTRVQRSARLSLDVARGRLDGRIDRVLRLVADQGGFVAGVQPVPAPTEDGVRTGQITFQVPGAKFDETLIALRGLGTTTDLQMSGVDVGGQYVDLQARLANARAQRDAYLALLARAQTISDILAIQDKLGAVTAQVEEYQGQLDALDRSTTYGTITVAITERPAAATGVGAALGQAGTNLAAVGQFLIVALGTLSPFLLVGAIGLGVWWRRRRRPRPAPAVG